MVPVAPLVVVEAGVVWLENFPSISSVAAVDSGSASGSVTATCSVVAI